MMAYDARAGAKFCAAHAGHVQRVSARTCGRDRAVGDRHAAVALRPLQRENRAEQLLADVAAAEQFAGARDAALAVTPRVMRHGRATLRGSPFSLAF